MRVKFDYLIAVNCRREIRLAALAFVFLQAIATRLSAAILDCCNSYLARLAHLPTLPLTFYSHVRLSNITFAGVATAANRAACMIIKARKLENTCPDAVRTADDRNSPAKLFQGKKESYLQLVQGLVASAEKRLIFMIMSWVVAMAMVRIAVHVGERRCQRNGERHFRTEAARILRLTTRISICLFSFFTPCEAY